MYVHVPFCSSICNYCNFNRGLYDEPLKSQFVAAVLQELRTGGRLPVPFSTDTLYFGGGTPSLLGADDIAAIIDQARASYGLGADSEITLEANPETVDSSRLEQFRQAGVNRLSFGVQSFRDAELQRLGRTHTAERARQAMRAARAAGFANISLDLMMWLPGQTLTHWLDSVQQAIDQGADHLSLYILEVYPHLPLRQEIDRRGWTLPPDDVAADMYESAMERLDRAGYSQYEISNVCRPGCESRHNLKYWTDGDWLGFGPGAHSTWKGTRWRCISSTSEYLQKVAAGDRAVVDVRRLSDDERLGDALFTGLRLNRGIDIEAMSKRYGVDVWRRFGARLAPYLEAGILCRQDTRLILSRKGMLLANEVMSAFV